METYDKDLQSIQEARTLVEESYAAQQEFLHFSQPQVDRIVEAMADAAFENSERLAKLAVEETGYGIVQHKVLKNQLGSRGTWEFIKDLKTVGVINEDKLKKIIEIAWPMGVVIALSPRTNPTSTVMHKTLISVKTRNGIVHAPHPAAFKCAGETLRIMREAGEKAGMPKGLIGTMTKITLPGTHELMKHKRTAVILATGGSDMVRVAHSMGKPAYGVGPGNVPCYVDRSADIKQAAKYIVSSKSFDNSTICATEQAIVADKPIAAQLRKEMEALGAYWVSREQANALANLLFFPNGGINPNSVGQDAQTLAKMAGIQVPASARVLVAPLNKVGKSEPLSREKLTTVLAWYEEDGWEAGCDRSIEMIKFGGRGHSIAIHATDEKVIMEFGLQKPVFRILVNTMSTLGSVGFTTSLAPSMTLGSGGIGGAITGDNITAKHLLNVKRIAYQTTPPPPNALIEAHPQNKSVSPVATASANAADVETIVRTVIEEVLRHTKN